MAYETTEVPVVKSQNAIRKLIYAHKGTQLALVSQPPSEGFDAFVTIDKISYHLRIMATCKNVTRDRRGRLRPSGQLRSAQEREERRVWRVLYWHLKAMFEAADSGVIDIRDVIMPYVVLRDGQTLSQKVMPYLPELMTMDSTRLLAGGSDDFKE